MRALILSVLLLAASSSHAIVKFGGLWTQISTKQPPSGVEGFRYGHNEIPIPTGSHCEKILLRMEQNLKRTMSDGEILKYLAVILDKTGENLEISRKTCDDSRATVSALSGDIPLATLRDGDCVFETVKGIERRFLISNLQRIELNLSFVCYLKVPFPVDPSKGRHHSCPP